MSYDRYVTKLNKEHEAMVQTISSVPTRSYIRTYLKKVLNEIVLLNYHQGQAKKTGRSHQLNDMKCKLAFNQMMLKAIENYLKTRTLLM